MKKLLGLLLILVIVSACTEQFEAPEDQLASSTTIDQNDPVVKDILSLGIAIEDIVEFDDYYIAENDILFLKEEPVFPDEDGENTNGRTGQAQSTFIVSSDHRAINIFLDLQSFTASIRPTVSSAFNTAITAYNNIGSDIVFTQVLNSATADIVVLEDSTIPFGYCGLAGFPFSNGRPFNTVRLSESTLFYYSITNLNQLRELIAHELGHCIGLRHTNWQSLGESAAIHIPGTPTSDNASVMNGASCGVGWDGFSIFDVSAINKLYDVNCSCSEDAEISSVTYDVVSSNEYWYQIDWSEIPSDYSDVQLGFTTNAGKSWIIKDDLNECGSGCSRLLAPSFNLSNGPDRFWIKAIDAEGVSRLCNGSYSSFTEVTSVNSGCEDVSLDNYNQAPPTFSYNNIYIDERNILYPNPYLPVYPTGESRRPISFSVDQDLPGSISINTSTGGLSGNAPQVSSNRTYTRTITGLYEGGVTHSHTFTIYVYND